MGHMVNEDLINKLVEEKVTLSIDEKYQLANNEAKVLKESVKKGKKKSDELLETLRAVLDETDLAIIEIRKDASDFQREILSGNQNSRTGKIDAERIIRYREMKLKQKDALIDKLKSKKSTLNHQIDKIKAQLTKKKELRDDLKFIDFHQLQIENKKYLKELKEKNDKLLDLKVETGQIVKALNDIKEQLNGQVVAKENKIVDIKNSLTSIAESEEFKEQNKKDFEERYSKLADLKAKITGKNNETDVMNIGTFIDDKEKEKKIKKNLRDIERKIDIAKLEYKQAVTTLKRRRHPPMEFDELSSQELVEQK